MKNTKTTRKGFLLTDKAIKKVNYFTKTYDNMSGSKLLNFVLENITDKDFQVLKRRSNNG